MLALRNGPGRTTFIFKQFPNQPRNLLLFQLAWKRKGGVFKKKKKKKGSDSLHNALQCTTQGILMLAGSRSSAAAGESSAFGNGAN